MTYLDNQSKQVDLYPVISLSIHRFEQFQKPRKEAAELRQAPEDWEVIERAKGMLLKKVQLDE